MKSRFLSSIFVPICASLMLSPLAFGGFKIQFTSITPGFEEGTAAAAALTRAANLWGQYITDNITVNIEVGFGATPLASTTVAYWSFPYDYTRNAIANAATTGGVDAIAKQLPTALQFKVESGAKPLSPNMLASYANWKALGDTYITTKDAGIVFSNISGLFDYDHSVAGGGVDPLKYDFET